jgi:hypothetical protein
LSRDRSRLIVRAILERRYGHKCPPEYIDLVTKSFRDDPIRLRDLKYTVKSLEKEQIKSFYVDKIIALCVNDRHDIHHVRDRGYVQAPVRIPSILEELNKTNLFEKVKVIRHSKDHILAVHDKKLFAYLKNVCSRLKHGKSVYPMVPKFSWIARLEPF